MSTAVLHILFWILLVAVWLPPGAAQAKTLYDAGLGTLPSKQGWLFGANGRGSQQQVSDGRYALDTRAGSDLRAGNSRNLFGSLGGPLLDTAAGFTLDLTLRIADENHRSTDRAGFSLLFVGNDPTQALEIAFWETEVWVYDYSVQTDFTHGVGYLLDTTALRDYTLWVQNGLYRLLVDGVEHLVGTLEDYTGAAAGAGFFDPRRVYGVPNFLFFGDDTSQADARVELTTVEFTRLGGSFSTQDVDVGSTLGLLLLGGLWLPWRFRSGQPLDQRGMRRIAA